MVIKKELNDMGTKKVWETIKKEDILKARRNSSTNGSFIQRNGIFRARLVARGYSQKNGCRFQRKFRRCDQ
jgi:tRNA splicing endonuclease